MEAALEADYRLPMPLDYTYTQPQQELVDHRSRQKMFTQVGNLDCPISEQSESFLLDVGVALVQGTPQPNVMGADCEVTRYYKAFSPLVSPSDADRTDDIEWFLLVSAESLNYVYFRNTVTSFTSISPSAASCAKGVTQCGIQPSRLSAYTPDIYHSVYIKHNQYAPPHIRYYDSDGDGGNFPDAVECRPVVKNKTLFGLQCPIRCREFLAHDRTKTIVHLITQVTTSIKRAVPFKFPRSVRTLVQGCGRRPYMDSARTGPQFEYTRFHNSMHYSWSLNRARGRKYVNAYNAQPPREETRKISRLQSRKVAALTSLKYVGYSGYITSEPFGSSRNLNGQMPYAHYVLTHRHGEIIIDGDLPMCGREVASSIAAIKGRDAGYLPYMVDQAACACVQELRCPTSNASNATAISYSGYISVSKAFQGYKFSQDSSAWLLPNLAFSQHPFGALYRLDDTMSVITVGSPTLHVRLKLYLHAHFPSLVVLSDNNSW
ncbi:hypothetical protein BDR06DRAFT_970446 [Suillus hirtellus]|nr:hypothetical protein BDR06DRAFT_970446 [Suillus hirtellus]